MANGNKNCMASSSGWVGVWWVWVGGMAILCHVAPSKPHVKRGRTKNKLQSSNFTFHSLLTDLTSNHFKDVKYQTCYLLLWFRFVHLKTITVPRNAQTRWSKQNHILDGITVTNKRLLCRSYPSRNIFFGIFLQNVIIL